MVFLIGFFSGPERVEMQGKQVLKESLFVYNLSIETFVPENHILRKINQIVDLSFVRELTQDKYCSNNGYAFDK